ncbi:hypothetical protein [Arthrobacter sp. Soil763]|uniref:hypothetical protein n=1 Tax=Arthrobacter sp. Soil763 TaxID=1736402 RepID=UPI0006F9D515|nr:hypothetical protein [Arthrobacter sp. Soil763]KRE81663.1 hypothetical protein ASG71_00895 [Arthrobacter sp. Soil763]
MTGTRNTQQDGSIQAMLRDSGLEAATELRSTLEGLQALVPDEAPAPRADLAALLASGAPAASGTPAAAANVTSLADRRRGHKRRMALIGGAVVGAMSLGAGAVAASSPDFRENVGHTFTVLFTPAKPAPAPAAPAGTAPADIPAAPVPVPAGTSTTAPAAAVPASPSPLATVPAPRQHAPAVTPPAGGRGGVLPTPDKRPVVPGLPGQNGRAIPTSPLPTVPAIPELPKTSSGS